MIHQNSLKNLKRGRKDSEVECEFCNKLIKKPYIKRHSEKCVLNPSFGTPCPKCGKLKHPDKKSCSTSCYNSLYRSGANNPNHSKNGGNRYRTICFQYHEKKCCICDFDLVIDVHHIDGNRNNNSPSNLVPLCPNHHRIIHSKYKNLIEKSLLDYIESKRSIA